MAPRLSRRKIDGTIFKQQVIRIRNAVSSIRESLRRLNDEKPGPQTSAMLIAKAAMALTEILEAVVNVEQLVSQYATNGVPEEGR